MRSIVQRLRKGLMFGLLVLVLAILLFPLARTVDAANEEVPVTVLFSSHPGSASLDEEKIIDIVRTSILLPSTVQYLQARVKVTFDSADNPQSLIVYLTRADISLSETMRILLGLNLSVLAIETDYQQPKSVLEPRFFSFQDADMLFVTAEDSISTAVEGVHRACDVASSQHGYTCDTLIGQPATVGEVKNYLTSNQVRVVGNIGFGNTDSILLSDGDLTSRWFDSLSSDELNGKLIYFNSSEVHNPPLLDSIMDAGTRTFIGGDVLLPIGDSEEVFKCFWRDALPNQIEMSVALAECETENGLVGFHGFSGDPGLFRGPNVNDKFAPVSRSDVQLGGLARLPIIDFDCRDGDAPTGLAFFFAARFENTSSDTLSGLVLVVNSLTGGNVLCNADEAPGSEEITLIVSPSSPYVLKENGIAFDGVLAPGESVRVLFYIGLKSRDPFTFLVDLYGVVN